MRKTALLLIASTLILACNNTTNSTEEKTENETTQVQAEYQYYGDSITDEGAIASSELLAMMAGNDSLEVKVEGTINSSCQVKGCWMKMDIGNGKEMRVSFKDYGFFVPKNLDGESAVMEGYALVDTTSVAALRHFAQDAGKSTEEIEAITEPEVGVSYVATGVIIKPKS